MEATDGPATPGVSTGQPGVPREAEETSEGLKVSRDGPVLRITLARPRVRNALTRDMHQGILEAIEQAGQACDVRVVVLAAEGEHFCAGVDLKAANSGAADASRPKIGHIQRGMAYGAHRVVRAIWDVQIPVVAAVRGHAAGMGCNLALACDYVIASRTAHFSQPFTARGFVPDTGACFLLPRLVGLARANEMLLFGRTIDAERALQWGLVNQVCDDDRLDEVTTEMVDELAGAATLAIGLTKELVHRCLDLDFQRSLAEEGFIQEVSLRSRDFKEGVASFLGRRPAQYRGE